MVKMPERANPLPAVFELGMYIQLDDVSIHDAEPIDPSPIFRDGFEG